MQNCRKQLTIDRTASSKTKPIVLFVGRLDARKGLDELLAAAAILEVEMNFVFVGWGEFDVHGEIFAQVEKCSYLRKIEWSKATFNVSISGYLLPAV